MRTFVYILYAFVAFISFSVEAREDFGNLNKPMTFKSAGNGGNCSSCVWTSAIGVITENTPQDFKKFAKSNGYIGDVVLHSPGGNLYAGLKLGKLFRKHKANTYIGKTQYVSELYSEEIVPGICASACAYAFLGGIDRQVAEKNIYALHQFYDENGEVGYSGNINASGELLSVDQVLSGIIAGYLAEMGVDSRVLSLASTAGKDGFVSLNEKEMSELNITTDFKWSDWTLETSASGLLMQQINEDPNDPLRLVTISCVKTGEPLIQVVTDRTQQFSSQELLSAVNDITVKFNENDQGVRIPTNRINAVSEKNAFLFQILLNRHQKQEILRNKTYQLEFNTAKYVFGQFLYANSRFNEKEMEKLRLVWSNCSQ